MTAPAPRQSASASLMGVWALFLGFAFLQVGNGLQRILLPIRAESEGFGATAMGLVMASHFAGYLVGAKGIMRALSSVGHVRTFAALASLASTAVLVNAVVVMPLSWAAVYFISGFCSAGIFVVLESWLNDRATNENRGRILSMYMVIMMGGTAVGQLLINVGAPTGFELFVLSSVLISAAVLPVTMSASTTPTLPSPESMPIREIYRTVPSAVVGLFLCSFVQAAASSMGAVFGTEMGMSTQRIALFTSAGVIGAVLLQMPLGNLSDRYPRRVVILAVAITSCGLSAIGGLLPGSSILLVVVNLLFGAFVFPLYGQLVALGNDWIPPERRQAAAAGFVVISSLGCITSPMVIAMSMSVFGPAGYFWTHSAVLALLVAYLSYRSRVREAVPVERQSPFKPILARSGSIAHTVGRWVMHPLAAWHRQGDDHPGLYEHGDEMYS